MTVVTKEMITTALHEAMIERNTYIDVENVLKPFLKGLCKIFYKKILWFRKI